MGTTKSDTRVIQAQFCTKLSKNTIEKGLWTHTHCQGGFIQTHRCGLTSVHLRSDSTRPHHLRPVLHQIIWSPYDINVMSNVHLAITSGDLSFTTLEDEDSWVMVILTCVLWLFSLVGHLSCRISQPLLQALPGLRWQRAGIATIFSSVEKETRRNPVANHVFLYLFIANPFFMTIFFVIAIGSSDDAFVAFSQATFESFLMRHQGVQEAAKGSSRDAPTIATLGRDIAADGAGKSFDACVSVGRFDSHTVHCAICQQAVIATTWAGPRKATCI